MILEPVIAIIVAITVVMIIFRIFFKTAFKIISIIWFVCFLGTIALAVLVYADAKDMQEKCPSMPPVFLLDDEGDILAGINVKIEGSNEGMNRDSVFIPDLGRYQEGYNEGGFDKMAEEEHCRVAVFKLQAFDYIESINLSKSISIKKDTINNVLRAKDPINALLDEDINIEETDTVETQVKGFIFAVLFAKALEEKGASFATKNLRNGNIKVYKETITFKLLKHAPISLMEEITSKIS